MHRRGRVALSVSHLLPVLALGRLRFLCGEGVVVQMSVGRCCAVQLVQSLQETRESLRSPSGLCTHSRWCTIVELQNGWVEGPSKPCCDIRKGKDRVQELTKLLALHKDRAKPTAPQVTTSSSACLHGTEGVRPLRELLHVSLRSSHLTQRQQNAPALTLCSRVVPWS